MINMNEQPGNARDDAENNMSDNQKKIADQKQQNQSNPSKSDKFELHSKQHKPVYIQDMPEIIPARTGII